MTFVVRFERNLLDLGLLFEVVHGVKELQVVGTGRVRAKRPLTRATLPTN